MAQVRLPQLVDLVVEGRHLLAQQGQVLLLPPPALPGALPVPGEPAGPPLVGCLLPAPVVRGASTHHVVGPWRASTHLSHPVPLGTEIVIIVVVSPVLLPGVARAHVPDVSVVALDGDAGYSHGLTGVAHGLVRGYGNSSRPVHGPVPVYSLVGAQDGHPVHEGRGGGDIVLPSLNLLVDLIDPLDVVVAGADLALHGHAAAVVVHHGSLLVRVLLLLPVLLLRRCLL
mmetsp:Transcript_5909/g.10752  ORF Transcript_5909/g.10752 Transcript_5909/m.10752 type:complete len:228 (+) Transcript_5909:871-1554(+)